jgi:PAS domain S-box-containing protein
MTDSAEARFRELADDAPVMLWLTDLSSECEFFNRRWLEFTGRTMEQELGVGWAEGVHFEDFQSCMASYLEAFAARRAFRIEYRHRRHDGEFRWILETGHPRGDGAEFRGFVGSCIDITEIREVQRMQRTLDEDLDRHALGAMTIVDPMWVVGAHAEADRVQNSVDQLRRAKAALRASQDRYRELSSRLVDMQERERTVLARELHDQLGQSLVGVSLTLNAIQGELTPSSRERIPETLQVIEQMLEQVRTIAFELRPSALDDLGLVAALRGLAKRHGERTGVDTIFIAAPTPVPIPAVTETACFRIVQEALTNVARHTRARHVEVRLAVRDDAFEIAVHDDGHGFDTNARQIGLGLVGMRERATLAGGQLDIESTPDAGTTVCARFPFPASNTLTRDDASNEPRGAE